MSTEQYSLTWESYKNNICFGLSSLQQSQEFVDMTLAADGHFVKVHQMVLSLASPYLKDLIKSAPCPHPVLFLNNVSYKTLCSILEYIYSGEVLVCKENINELLNAGKALHIKGLDTMTINKNKESEEFVRVEHVKLPQTSINVLEEEGFMDLSEEREIENTSNFDDDFQDTSIAGDNSFKSINKKQTSVAKPTKNSTSSSATIQYTLSTHGNIQMILNRYMYRVRYNYRNSNPPVRCWKCVDHVRSDRKCPATVITQDNIVVKRIGAHNHEFHDKKILKKIQAGKIFTAVKDIEEMEEQMKNDHK